MENQKNDDRLQIRVTKSFKTKAKIRALQLGHKNVSEYIVNLVEKDLEKKEGN